MTNRDTAEIIMDRASLRQMVDNAIAAERERCAEIALAIDSGRGNEKEIARAICNPK